MHAHIFTSFLFLVVSKNYYLDNRNEAMYAINRFWKYSVFNQHIINVDFSKDKIAFITIENLILNFIVNQEHNKISLSVSDNENVYLAMNILKFAEHHCSDKNLK